MNTASVAVPVRRVRRIRPPSAWTIYNALTCVVALGFVAHAAVEIGLGHPLWAINATVWSVAYVAERRNYQHIRRLDRTDAALPPVPRWRWMLLASLTAYQAFEWLIV